MAISRNMGSEDHRDARDKGHDRGTSTIRSLLIGALVLAAGYWIDRLAFRPTEPAPQAENKLKFHPIGKAHETRDASVGWIFGVVGIFVVGAVVIHFALASMAGWLNRKPAAADDWQPQNGQAAAPSTAAPVYPKLQVSPPADLQAFRAREDERLNSYGWVNRTSGIVHIPISAAMDLLLKRGLPVRKSDSDSKAAGGISSYELQLQRVEQRPKSKEAVQ